MTSEDTFDATMEFEFGKEWPAFILVERFAFDPHEGIYEPLPYATKIYVMQDDD